MTCFPFLILLRIGENIIDQHRSEKCYLETKGDLFYIESYLVA